MNRRPIIPADETCLSLRIKRKLLADLRTHIDQKCAAAGVPTAAFSAYVVLLIEQDIKTKGKK